MEIIGLGNMEIIGDSLTRLTQKRETANINNSSRHFTAERSSGWGSESWGQKCVR